jgi:hypothetical protein
VAADLESESVEVLFIEPSFQKGSGIDTRRRVTLEIDMVTRLAVGLATEKVIEADFVERG